MPMRARASPAHAFVSLRSPPPAIRGTFFACTADAIGTPQSTCDAWSRNPIALTHTIAPTAIVDATSTTDARTQRTATVPALG